jgi:outer membrane protein OmpA-like peptidoglycan-associated protein
VLVASIEDRLAAGAPTDAVFRIVRRDREQLDIAYDLPGAVAGIASVAAVDLRTSHRLRQFWTNAAGPLAGWTALVVSTDVWRDLAAGRRTRFEIDGPRATEWLEPAGVERQTLLLDDQPVAVRTIVARSNNGFTWWIADDESAPLVVKLDNGWTQTITAVEHLEAVRTRLLDALRQQREVTTHAILFASGGTDVRDGSGPVLDAIGRWVKDTPKLVLTVEAPDGAAGGRIAAEPDLGERRAARVKQYLADGYGIDPARIVCRGAPRDGGVVFRSSMQLPAPPTSQRRRRRVSPPS